MAFRYNPLSDNFEFKVDRDRYIGTLGLTSDVHARSISPNHTSWPSANKGDWLRVNSNLMLSGIMVLEGQEWRCTVDRTPENTPANWELLQPFKVTPYEKITQVGHGFSHFDVITEVNGAYLHAALPNLLDNIWCLRVIDADTFLRASIAMDYYCPNHGLGNPGEPLFLSSTPGKLSSVSPGRNLVPKQELMIASVVDANTLHYERQIFPL